MVDTELDRFHNLELDGWRRLAGGYAGSFEPLVTQAIDPLLDAAGISRGTRVLDLCCGPGYVAAAAKRRGAEPIGIDFAPEMIALAKARWSGIPFQEGDAEALELPERSFDAVVLNFGLLHLARPELAMSHIASVLKPGGKVAFTTWAPPAESTGHRIMLQAINEHGKADVGLPAGPPLFRFADPQETRSLFAGAGLVDVAIRKLPHHLDLSGPDGLFDFFVAGAVRISVLLARQSPDAYAHIRQAVREASAGYERDGKFSIPMASVLASARRP
jgi:ubiquinone/menaquinone biosynthesis C-methylase UbiE